MPIPILAAVVRSTGINPGQGTAGQLANLGGV
jgi:hypothetical protein